MSSPVPIKSQQLHNFSLPQLKWNKKHNTSLHRRRRPTESPPHPHRSPIRDAESDHQKDDVEKSEKDSKAKIYIRIKKNTKAAESADEDTEKRLVDDDQDLKKDEIEGEKGGVVENCEIEEVEEPKTWNLRPRRAVKKGMNAENSGTIKAQENRTRSRPDVVSSSNNGEKKDKKQKFSVSLSREEIEEDFLVMTGSKPPRRPKKRAKTVQRQIDVRISYTSFRNLCFSYIDIVWLDFDFLIFDCYCL